VEIGIVCIDVPYTLLIYTVKKVTDFPVLSRDVTNQTNSPWPGMIKLFPEREVWIVTSRLRTGKIANVFLTVYCVIPWMRSSRVGE
jgi:hypothetical protein